MYVRPGREVIDIPNFPYGACVRRNRGKEGEGTHLCRLTAMGIVFSSFPSPTHFSALDEYCDKKYRQTTL